VDVGRAASRQPHRLLTAIPTADGSLAGHGVRDGEAMIATLPRPPTATIASGTISDGTVSDT
jgi:hypothetical protein